MANNPKRPTPADPLLDGNAVAAELSISLTTLWRWRKAGALPEPARLPGPPRWRRSVIENLKGDTPVFAGGAR